MISEKMIDYVKGGSLIRAMFEEGKRMASIYGPENVFDFSLGNPNLEAPKEVKDAIIDILTNEESTMVHGYMPNAGYDDVRGDIAAFLNKTHGTNFNKSNILMTVGAAGGLNVIFKALLNPGDEVIVFAPYFGEYRSYVANYEGKLVVISANTVDFQPNLKELEEKITNKTKMVIINSPNNPTGVIYSEKTIEKLSEILESKEKEYGSEIYLISDEPYRELAYDGIEVPYITKYYHNAIVGYSYSKSLSLPGERIGYLVIPKEVNDFEDLIAAATVANRILGFVNAPSLFQRVIARCVDSKVDLEFYDKNRRLLYNTLTEYGYQCVKPEGAFYLFVKTPIEDDTKFVDMAKKHNLLIVPGSFFGAPGYMRIAYCVSYDTIERALPKFKTLLEEVMVNC